VARSRTRWPVSWSRTRSRQGGTIAEDVRPGIPLAERLGRIFTALAGGVAAQLDIEVRGEITQHDVKVLELAALKGVFTDVVESATVSYVNAPLLAAERGVEVRLMTSSESPDWRNLVTVRGTLASGSWSTCPARCRLRHIEKLVALDGFDIELEPTDHRMFLKYEDRPGVVGIVGGI
jgi:D-3-phosphoglycerate dehydrogenase